MMEKELRWRRKVAAKWINVKDQLAKDERRKVMRAVKIKITGELLLELMGLEVGGIKLYTASIEWPNILAIVLTGDDDRLPEVAGGQVLPDGIVVCHKIEAEIQIVK